MAPAEFKGLVSPSKTQHPDTFDIVTVSCAALRSLSNRYPLVAQPNQASTKISYLITKNTVLRKRQLHAPDAPPPRIPPPNHALNPPTQEPRPPPRCIPNPLRPQHNVIPTHPQPSSSNIHEESPPRPHERTTTQHRDGDIRISARRRANRRIPLRHQNQPRARLAGARRENNTRPFHGVQRPDHLTRARVRHARYVAVARWRTGLEQHVDDGLLLPGCGSSQ